MTETKQEVRHYKEGLWTSTGMFKEIMLWCFILNFNGFIMPTLPLQPGDFLSMVKGGACHSDLCCAVSHLPQYWYVPVIMKQRNQNLNLRDIKG